MDLPEAIWANDDVHAYPYSPTCRANPLISSTANSAHRPSWVLLILREGFPWFYQEKGFPIILLFLFWHLSKMIHKLKKKWTKWLILLFMAVCSVLSECFLADPCQNGGTCYDGVGQYNCVCVPGFSGKHCQNDINECASSPCQNNAPVMTMSTPTLVSASLASAMSTARRMTMTALQGEQVAVQPHCMCLEHWPMGAMVRAPIVCVGPWWWPHCMGLEHWPLGAIVTASSGQCPT